MLVEFCVSLYIKSMHVSSAIKKSSANKGQGGKFKYCTTGKEEFLYTIFNLTHVDARCMLLHKPKCTEIVTVFDCINVHPPNWPA